MHYTPTLLLILDGWGIAPASRANAVSLAQTPVLDRLLLEYPSTSLDCSGQAVGLPDGFMGNSEVGHMNIGAGRIVHQYMTRIDKAVAHGELAQRTALQDLFTRIKKAGSRLHLMGLVSDGGVHSHIRHLAALLHAARQAQVETVVHCFMDGRDTAPDSGADFIRAVQQEMETLGHGRIASIMGRYYAMDRDNRWDRTCKAYDALTAGRGKTSQDLPGDIVRKAYAAGETDEFITPRICLHNGEPVGLLAEGDGVLCFNFRADRVRQLMRMLWDDAFDECPRARRPRLAGLVSMTPYDEAFSFPVLFGPEPITDPVGKIVAQAGLKQLRIAETEKYAHVTYFFNCGHEEPYPGEERILIASPRDVATYDEKPAMSAVQVTDSLIAAIEQKDFTFFVCNLANLDMVGHTGNIEATRQAAETVDSCVARIVTAMEEKNGRVLLTADHGNAEEMQTAAGNAMTAHSMNRVPFVFIDKSRQGAAYSIKSSGILADIAPTILGLWGMTTPDGMTGTCLLPDRCTSVVDPDGEK